MKTILTIAFSCITFLTWGAEPATQPVAAEVAVKDEIRVFFIGDQTGDELLQKHGIRPIKMEDLTELVNAVMLSKNSVRLFYLEVVEDVSKSALSQLVFKTFAGGPPPKMPTGNIPVYQYDVVRQAYDAKRTQWQREIRAYQHNALGEANAFVQHVADTQAEVAQRFDKMLADRNGRDFDRSDVVGTIQMANTVLGAAGKRVLVLNTDADDCPANRKRRHTPLTAKDLDPGIELIFVNTSRIPEQSVLFAGIPNTVHHADSIAEAMNIVAGMLEKPTP
jgi:hypothetical protein